MVDRTLIRGVIIVAMVAMLPWVAVAMPGFGVFGFPFSAFTMLIAGPLLLVALVRGGGDGDDEPGDDVQ